MRLRITVERTGDRTEDLRIAARMRRDLYAHSPAEVDPDNPMHGIHRDESGCAYFEFSTALPDEVQRVIDEFGYSQRVKVSPQNNGAGEACQNCGNIAGALRPPVCPNCGFRDVSPCPSCGEEIPRGAYVRRDRTLFSCPSCHSSVRLRFNDPMFLSDGTYHEPLVVVEEVEVPAT